MAETLRIASEKGAYVLADKATWLVLKSTLSLEVLVENDKALLNAYHVITVNPAGRPRMLTAAIVQETRMGHFGKAIALASIAVKARFCKPNSLIPASSEAK